MKNKPILVFDGNFLAHACRFTNQIEYHGKECGVIHSIFGRILDVSQAYKSDRVVIVWDSKHSFRKRKYNWYKQKRAQDRKELSDQEKADLQSMYKQVDELQRIFKEIDFKNSFCQNGLEGDDLMAMICRNYGNSRIILIASDHDLFQLIDYNVAMLTPKGEYLGKEYRQNDFEKEFGISARQWYLVKAIAGCTSDEVPGVGRDILTNEIKARIGEKTACQYLSGKLKETTKAYQRIVCDEAKKIISRNEELVRLPHRCTAPVILNDNNWNFNCFRRICKKYGFTDFLVERIDEWREFLVDHYENKKNRQED